MTDYRKTVALWAAVYAWFAPFALAEAPPFRGRVLDATGAAIRGARVAATPGESTAISDQAGEFSLALAAGSYTLRINASGFVETSAGITAPAAGSALHDFVLQVAEVHAAITVTEPASYQVDAIRSGTKTLTPLRDVPQAVTVVPQDLIKDQAMMSIADVVRYVPGVTCIQGENNRDQVVIRGNSSSADFFLDGVRDDVQYYRDLYNVDSVEALKGPNAMIFGRGGGGGVINRVTKEAGFTPLHEITLMGGSYGDRRFAADFDQPLADTVAFRMNGVYENSDSFRRFVGLERYGVNPTLNIAASGRTRITLGYEHFHDGRVADRGVPSFQGRPAGVPVSTFFGDPGDSRVHARVDLATAAVEHQAGGFNIRNRTMYGDYDRGYQNYVPGAVTADRTQVSLSAYNNATRRRNLFSQTDATSSVRTGRIKHTLLAGVEAGRQWTDNFRNTGYFGDTAVSLLVPYANPVIDTPAIFRQSATDADNHIQADVAAAYAQDQVELSRFFQVVAGVRFDHFDLRYRNNRNGANLRRIDNIASPRAGVVFKPATAASLYLSYSVSFLPSSGDQFSSLTVVTQQLKPEKFTNWEFGGKWDIDRFLSATMAVYRLDRTNTRATDPNDPARILQTGSQRSNGFEFGVTGSVTRFWKIAGGYAYQDAFITSATAAARAGAQVAQAPHHTLSLWNNCRLSGRWSVGLGIVRRTDMYAAVDNTVTLPGYTEASSALFFSLTERIHLQANMENLLNRRYYVNADSNNNISPGSPRTVRVGVTARF